jgi:predicted TPR repeat methyltransferase
MTNLYDADYYERGVETGKSCYSNFRWIPELTIPMCHTICEQLKITDEQTILDFGCAKGYVVKGMRLLHKNAYGVDLSEYAISQADASIRQYLYCGEFPLQNKKRYNWILSKDVFEHIPYDSILDILKHLKTSCENLFCIVPLGENGKYVVPSYELDVTHIIREPLEWWSELFKEAGFQILSAEYNMTNMKENYANFEKGNGFFKLSAK